MRLSLALLATLVIGSCASSHFEASQNAQVPPNVLFVLYDDLDWIGDLEPYGAEAARVRTPFANRLASSGRRFERFYVNAPVCSPTRMSLLTGEYPTRFGFTWASEETSRRGLPVSQETLPRLLQRRGYLTGAFGKWHIGSSRDALLPESAGFDRAAINCSFTNLGRVPGGTLEQDAAGFGYEKARFCARPGPPLADSGRSFATTYTVDKALELIEDALDAPPGRPPGTRARPFYAQIWLHAPHTPLTCPPGAVECPDCQPASTCSREQKRRIHHAMIHHAESQLMRIYRDLEARGILENTWLILASDNGGVGGWHEPSKALRGAKGSLYERGGRTPLILAGPGVEPGVVGDEVLGIDLLPTLAQLLGLPIGEHAGVSFADLLRPESGNASVRRTERALFWHLRPRTAFDQHTLAGTWQHLAVHKKIAGRRLKLVKTDLYGGSADPQLFDLDADPAETRDLGPTRPAARHYLLDRWRAWRLETTAIHRSLPGRPLRLDGRGEGVTVEEHPALTVGRMDFTVALELTVRDSPDAWIVGRPGAWSLRLEHGRLVFSIDGHRPQRLEHPAVLIPGEPVRVVATITNRRGLALFVDDWQVWARFRFGSIAESERSIQVGSGPGSGPFIGEIRDLTFYPVALDAADLPLRGLGRAAFGSRVAFEGRRTPEVPLPEAGPTRIQARLPVRALEDSYRPFDITVECLQDGLGDWHPRARSVESRLADADSLTHTVRHLCPARTDAVRLAVADADALELGPVDLSLLGTAALDLGFEAMDPELEALRGHDRVDVAHTGLASLRLPPSSSTPRLALETDGVDGLEVEAWARTETGDASSSLRLELSCLDEDGRSLETPTGTRPENRAALTSPARVDGAWRRFQLRYSCPRDAGVAAVGLRLEAGTSALLIDDVRVVVPSRPSAARVAPGRSGE